MIVIVLLLHTSHYFIVLYRDLIPYSRLGIGKILPLFIAGSPTWYSISIHIIEQLQKSVYTVCICWISISILISRPNSDCSYNSMEHQKGRVLYQYSARESDEISIQKGEEFTLIESFDDDWWMIRVRDKEGMAPSNFLSIEDSGFSRQNSTELIRIQALREEAAVKIDALRY